MKSVKMIFFSLLGVLFLLLFVCIVNAYLKPSRQIKVKESYNPVPLPDEVFSRLSEAVTYKTVTPAINENRDSAAFRAFHRFLERSFPLVHQKLSKKEFKEFAILFEWKGKNPNLKPILFVAHQDVVPADNESDWEVPPFSGERRNGFVYGRGTLDIKSGLLGILEAAEQLLKEGYQPERTIYFSFGHDEEGKGEGAKAIADYLKQNKIQLEYVLDEGGIVLNKALPGIDKPVALIGIAEKGFCNVKITSKGLGGHSSMPAKESPVTSLAKAINRINEKPMPASLTGTASALFDFAAPEMKFPLRVIFSNQWLFAPVIKSQMEKAPSSNAAIRTTMAFTMLEGSSKENVIPSKANALLNSRLLPGDTPDKLLQHLKETVNDENISFELTGTMQLPGKISDTSSAGFKKIQRTISAIAPDLVVAPFLLVALTDSRFFTDVADDIYRFNLVRYEKKDIERLHGNNERIREEDYKRMIWFYREMMK